jgi:hypothetical protein
MKHAFRFALTMLVATVTLLAPSSLQASPIVGARITASGSGSSHVEILAPSGVFVSQIFLVSPVSMFIGLSTEVGKVVQLGHFPAGVELVFQIHVLNTGDNFFTGPATRNPDGIAHAAVDFINPVQAIVEFEDLFGGGDLDFNDVNFRVKR